VRGLAANDRPREKLGRLGPSGLGDNELLAIVIGGGARGVGALALANNVLEVAGGLHGLLRLTSDDLCQTAGVGTARAAQVLAALELGRRSLLRRQPERRRLVSPSDVAELLLPEFGARPVEQFGVVLLDTKHRVQRTVVVSSGGLDSTPVQVRDVFRHAAAGSAAAVVVFHNHPSGDPRPSEDDLRLTARLVAAGELMGIPVLDHVVLGDGRYWSCKETGGLGTG
jgi:DNA repair protein RadC